MRNHLDHGDEDAENRISRFVACVLDSSLKFEAMVDWTCELQS